MKTRTQLLMGMLGLGILLSFPVLAQNKPARDSLDSTLPSLEEAAPSIPNLPAPNGQTPDSSADAAPASSNLVEQAASTNQFQTLATAIKAAGLEKTLAVKGPYTVFAPTDEAFAALPPGILEQLLRPENREALVQLLSHHIVPGAVTSSQIEPEDVKTLADSSVRLERRQDGTFTVNNATVTQADIQASNGVIHAVDEVILPPKIQSQLEAAPSSISQN